MSALVWKCRLHVINKSDHNAAGRRGTGTDTGDPKGCLTRCPEYISNARESKLEGFQESNEDVSQQGKEKEIFLLFFLVWGMAQLS